MKCNLKLFLNNLLLAHKIVLLDNTSHNLMLSNIGNNCHISCLHGCNGQIYVGTTLGTVVILNAIKGQVVSQFSLHANKVSVLLELPLQVKPCICAELPQEKIGLTSTQSKKEKSSLPSVPVEGDDIESTLKKRGTSVVTKSESTTSFSNNSGSSSNSSTHSQQPLFLSTGDGLANWFGNKTDTSQDLHLLTWTDDYV